MSLRYFKITFVVLSLSLLCCLLFSLAAQAQEPQISDKRITVAMRSIGHEVLMNCGDKESRVLPVQKVGSQYEIPFESQFGFNPDDIISIVDSVMTTADIASHYIVEVVKCDTREVVHSFEIGNKVNSDMLPCRGRDLPVDCYSIVISFLEGDNLNTLVSVPDELSSDGVPLSLFSKIQANPIKASSLIVFMFVLIGILLYFKNNNTVKIPDHNLVLIGGSHFDKRNMALSFRNKKVDLSNKESELLSLLHDSANTPIEREVILQKVWGDEGDYIGRTLDVFISKLRKKLEDDASVKIVNIRGVGYKLVIDTPR